MLEDNDVRISGQDVGRGTFSHRHAMLVDQQTENVIVPLNSELGSDGKLELANSRCLLDIARPLKLTDNCRRFFERNGCDGGECEVIDIFYDRVLIFCQFEYGASWERPNLLPIWEAQVSMFRFNLIHTDAPLAVRRFL